MSHVYLDAQVDVGAARDEAARQRRTRAGNVDHFCLEGVDVAHVAADGHGPLPLQLILGEGRVGEAEAARHRAADAAPWLNFGRLTRDGGVLRPCQACSRNASM